MIKPRQGFIAIALCACVCVRPSVCLLTTYLKKYLIDQLDFWWRPFLWHKDEVIRFWEKSPQGKGGPGGGVEIWP